MEEMYIDSSEDEVFVGPMTAKEEILYRRYAHRRTEQYYPDFRTNRKSIVVSEDYFGDISRVSEENCVESPNCEKESVHSSSASDDIVGPDDGDVSREFTESEGNYVESQNPEEDSIYIGPIESRSITQNANTHGSSMVCDDADIRCTIETEKESFELPSESRDSGLDSKCTLSVRDNTSVQSPHKDNVVLADLSLPSFLIEHYAKCSVREDSAIASPTRAVQVASVCTAGTQSPVEMDVSSEDDGLLDTPVKLTETDSESCDEAEAFLIWNRELMAAAKCKATPVAASQERSQRNSQHEKNEMVMPLQANVRHRVLNETMSEMRLLPQNPSTLVQALQLTPTKPLQENVAPPRALESLDLSVDERISVDRFFKSADKENCGSKNRLSPKPPGHLTPMKELLNIGTPVAEGGKSGSGVKNKPAKTRIPVSSSRHAKCFNVYSSKKFQDLKAKSMQNWKHVSSPVAQYIKQYPVPPLIQNVRVFKELPRECVYKNKLTAATADATLFPLPTPCKRLPVAKYAFQGPTPPKVDPQPPKYKYFPTPKIPVVIKHTGPSHVIEGSSYLHGEESVLAGDGNTCAPQPSQVGSRRSPTAEESMWHIVPRKHF